MSYRLAAGVLFQMVRVNGKRAWQEHSIVYKEREICT